MTNFRFRLFMVMVAMLISASQSFAQPPTAAPATIPTPKPTGKATPKPAVAPTPSAKPSPTPAPKVLNVAETWALVDKPDIRTLKLNSKLMGREMPYRVIVPRDYEFMKTAQFPVIYLLHGLTGHYDNWTEKTRIGEYERGFNYIIVMPEGGDGWYTDSVSVGSDKYESYIVNELIYEVEKNFRTKPVRESRAIAGLSMGGYGAIKFGLKYPEKFVLVGSFSGALQHILVPTEYMKTRMPSLENVFGPDGSQTRKDNDIFRIVKDATPENIKQLPFIYLDSGTEDIVFNGNMEFMKLLVEKKVPNEYRHRPGDHNWNYWDAQIQEFLRLSEKYIKK